MEAVIGDSIRPAKPQLPVEGLSSPLGAQMFDFCDNGFFPEALQTSEVSSSSGFCLDENSYVTDLSFPSFSIELGNFGEHVNCNDNENNNSNNNSNQDEENNNSSRDETLCIFLDSQQENEPENPTSLPAFPIPSLISAEQHDQFDMSAFQPQIPLTEMGGAESGSSFGSSGSDVAPPPPQPLLMSVLEEDCPSTALPSYVHLDPPLPSCSALDESGLSGFLGPPNMNAGISVEAYDMFSRNAISEMGFQSQDLDFQGENGSIYCAESVYSSEELQVFGEKQQQQLVVSGCGSPAGLASDMSGFEDSSYKVRRLSVEERKEKIHKYMKKRNERNFTKKIKYACRKHLADSRPRVRGRFAKNEDFGEVVRATFGSNHEDEDSDGVVVKEEAENMHDSSDIFAHISGVNSLACSYPIQSWM